MQMVYIAKPEIAAELQAKGYKLCKNKALRVSGAFCFEADRKLINLLASAYNESDYIVDPLLRYASK